VWNLSFGDHVNLATPPQSLRRLVLYRVRRASEQDRSQKADHRSSEAYLKILSLFLVITNPRAVLTSGEEDSLKKWLYDRNDPGDHLNRNDACLNKAPDGATRVS